MPSKRQNLLGPSPILSTLSILGDPIWGDLILDKNINKIEMFLITDVVRVPGIQHREDSVCSWPELLRPLCIGCLLTRTHSGVVGLNHVEVVRGVGHTGGLCDGDRGDASQQG